MAADLVQLQLNKVLAVSKTFILMAQDYTIFTENPLNSDRHGSVNGEMCMK